MMPHGLLFKSSRLQSELESTKMELADAKKQILFKDILLNKTLSKSDADLRNATIRLSGNKIHINLFLCVYAIGRYTYHWL